MDKLNRYEIQFASLGVGTHTFSFSLRRSFFEGFANRVSDDFLRVENGEAEFTITLDKKEYMLTFAFQFEGFVWLPCDRCTDPLKIEISGDRNLHVRFSEEKTWHEDEYMHLPPGAYKLEVADLMYEYIQLAIPVRHVHDEGMCNTENINHLARYLIKDKNGSIEKQITDPRWDKLKDLKTNKK